MIFQWEDFFFYEDKYTSNIQLMYSHNTASLTEVDKKDLTRKDPSMMT